MININSIRLNNCDPNTPVIASYHFETIDDFINLEMSCKKFKGNLEKMKHNPIPLNKTTRKFFPNITSQWIYSDQEQIFRDGKIENYVYFNRIPWLQA